jgi:hypothetical protein
VEQIQNLSGAQENGGWSKQDVQLELKGRGKERLGEEEKEGQKEEEEEEVCGLVPSLSLSLHSSFG